MSIGLFYNVSDWINNSIIKHIRQKGIKVEPIDINKFILDIHNKNKFKHKLYINRVYPSSNISSYNNLRFMLEIIRHIENIGIPVINSFNATYMDYSKTEANNILEKHNIPTARTLLFSNLESARKAANKLKFPKIIKMDCGGKARNVYKADSKRDYLNIISRLSKGHHLIHVEDFYESKGYSTRLFILNYKLVSATKRNLISGWIGSITKGSKSTQYTELPTEIRKLGEKIARVTNSKILGLDITETKKSPVVIDFNATPAFLDRSTDYLGFDPSKAIADYISSEHSK